MITVVDMSSIRDDNDICKHPSREDRSNGDNLVHNISIMFDAYFKFITSHTTIDD